MPGNPIKSLVGPSHQRKTDCSHERGRRGLGGTGATAGDSNGPLGSAANRAGKQGVAQQKGRGVAVCAAVRAGRASRQLASSPCGLHPPRRDLAMVSTRTRAIARRDVAMQTELPQKHAATQVSGCRECQGLALMMEGCRDNIGMRCEQVEDLLSMVAELKEEVTRLRTIRECKREIDWWSHSLPSLRRAHQLEASREGEAPLPSCHQAEGGDPKNGGEWKQIPARHRRQILSRPTLPSQVLLHNRYKALELEGLEDEDADSDPSKGLTRGNQSAPRITMATDKKKRRVIVTGDSLLRGYANWTPPIGKSAASLRQG